MAKRGRSGRGDIDTLPGRTQAATAGVKALSGAFNDLSSKGKLSASSLSQMAAASAQLHPALGLVGAGIGLVVAQSERLKELELNDSLVLVAAGAKVLTEQFDIMAARMSANTGESNRLVERITELAEVQVRIRTTTGAYREEVERLTEQVRDGITTQEMADARMADSQRLAMDHLASLHTKRLALEKEITTIRGSANAQRDRIAALETSIEQEKAAANAIRETEIAFFMSERQRKESVVQLGAEAATYERLGDIAASAIGNTAAGAFNAYADALDKTVSLNAIFAGGFDRSMRNMAASVLRSVGQQAAVKAAFELAESAAAYARYDFVSGSEHLRAAGLYGGVALLAGAAAGGMSVKPSGGGGRRGGGGGGGHGDARGGGPTVHVTVLGQLDDSQANELGRRIAGAMSRSDS